MAAHPPLFVKGSLSSLPSSSPSSLGGSAEDGWCEVGEAPNGLSEWKDEEEATDKGIGQAPNGTNTCPDYVPEANFYKIEAILRPWRISHVTSGLLKMGIRGLTVSDVRGFGAQGASPERQAGSEFSKDKFVSKVKMEIVVSKDQVEAVIDTIIDEARTGEIGDGKIFVVPVADVIRVRTGERGHEAERMAGGRSDILSGARQEFTNSN